MAGISAVLGFAYLALLRFFAKPILYISFVTIICAFIGGGFYAFFSYKYYSLGDHTMEVMKGMGILLWILAGLMLLTICCCWSRIKLGAAITQAASDFVGATPSILPITKPWSAWAKWSGKAKGAADPPMATLTWTPCARGHPENETPASGGCNWCGQRA